ncbi:MAG: NACHT domain-containing protein, partial [Anaerolineae bacterium]|nr:NACHT domain-containing protein [Anaerolineae bacterium]
ECKPLYIFVSIQYIDFVMNEPNGFTLLRERLKEMTQPVREAAPALEEEAGAKAAADELMTEADELMMEADELMSAAPKPAPEPEPTPEASENEKRRRESVLDDGLFGGAAPQAPAASTSGATPPPAPEISIPMPSKPAAPITVPQPAPASREGLYPGAAPQRKSASVPMWAVGAVATILIVVAGIVLISPMSGALPQPAGRADIPPLLIVGAVVVVVGGLGLWWWRGRSSPRRSSALPDATMALSNRQQMLTKVETFWIQGVLEKALEAGRLDIGLASAPGTVLRHKDYGNYHLPAEMNILDVFNDLNRELLILGAPGGGKTVLLLQLAEKLLQQARSAPDKAMPVVFNLSSWAAERKPLGEWLVDELRQKYQIPKAVAQEWVEGEQLLLLLDGLDEVAAAYREACVEAINAFRQQYRTVDLAVCSRSEDYEALTAKLDVRGAVVLDALHEDQINDYLNRPALEALRAAMADDPELRDMSRVPFLLNAMAYAYWDASYNEIITISEANTVSSNIEVPREILRRN